MRNDDTRKKQTEEKLLRCAKRRFLSEGYAGASLRDICKDAGVTTGALYFSFDGKAALLAAILDPVLAEAQKMWRELAKHEIAAPDTAEENERIIIEFLSAHRDEAIILLDKCDGSAYERVRDGLEEQMRAEFTRFYEKHLGCEPDAELMRILASMRLHGYLEIIKGNYTMEQREFLAKAVGIHADAGTRSLIEYLNSKAENARR